MQFLFFLCEKKRAQIFCRRGFPIKGKFVRNRQCHCLALQKPSRRVREDPLLMSVHDEDDEDMDDDHDLDRDEREEEEQENRDPAPNSQPPTTVTPTGTPIKNLPFSPSQVDEL